MQSVYMYEQDEGCTGVLAVLQMKTRKGEGLLCAEVVEKESEILRGRTDIEGGRW